ncbi:MAG: hypothetical protein PHI52_00895 [Bacteroidales bacterium]|nr:hypothetical protein [Bacteroidales bacterium]
MKDYVVNNFKAINYQYAVGQLSTCIDLEGCSLETMMFEKYPSISPYTYCANNPVNAIDPKGETIEDPPKGSFVSSGRIEPTNLPFSGGKLLLNVCSEAARGTLNMGLFVGGVVQIIGGNIVYVARGRNNYPNLGIPRQLNKNWGFETKSSWMGFGATGDISQKDAVDGLVNTGSVVLSFFPFTQLASTAESIVANTLISTAVSTGASMIVNEVRDSKNTQTANSNSATNVSSSTQDRFNSSQKSKKTPKTSNYKLGWSLYNNQNNNDNNNNLLFLQ